MKDFINRNIEVKATTLMTDSSPTYKSMDKVRDRLSVNHSKGEYAKNDVHINTIETFFAHLKRSIKGTYKAISKQHLQSYLDSFVFHYNNRHNDKERFGVLLGTLLQSVR
jgi:transposase